MSTWLFKTKVIVETSALIFLLFSNSFTNSGDEIKGRIEKELGKIPSGTNYGLMIYNPLTQDTLISVNHTRSMIPASITKLFTTAAALEIMGGDYVLKTQILVDDKDLSDEVVNGNIYIKGFGNPMFTDDDLQNLVDSFYKSGVRKVDGDVIGDDSFFDDIYTRDDWIKDEDANVTLPPISALVIDRNKTVVTRKKKGRYRNYFVNITNPPLYAAKKLKEKLEQAGINVTGETKTDLTPSTAYLFNESAVELREVIKPINKNSDNFAAECLFKSIGAIASGKQGNSLYSTQAILTFIKENEIYSEGTAVVDGSGISRFDQITVGAIIGVLEKMYFDLKHYEDFFNSMSIAGIDGTLDSRMRNTSAYNNFRGKTGTLNGVSSISGYLTTQDGEDYIVGMIFEFTRGGANKFRNIQDNIIEILAGWKNESPDSLEYQGLKDLDD
ncbi:MAG TPA: D-alanyl-D-alanine carboxypeptidase/D-alanyl-D-alanine-endopeptidase [Ignavibacteriaceae bacterium]|nr:D-alanyl-D-alanine carboxypeptidase/D-alanyl-D-alanine-endopeptidase [Ignavibacteriaceae bacterium]